MGADGYITLAKIGRNQHLLRPGEIQFTVKPGRKNLVAVLYLWRQALGSRWTNLTTMIPELDSALEIGAATIVEPIYGWTDDGQQSALLGGIAVIPWSQMEIHCAGLLERWNQDPDCEFQGLPMDEQAWTRITAGLWVLKSYTASGCGEHYHAALQIAGPTPIEILTELKWHWWT